MTATASEFVPLPARRRRSTRSRALAAPHRHYERPGCEAIAVLAGPHGEELLVDDLGATSADPLRPHDF